MTRRESPPPPRGPTLGDLLAEKGLAVGREAPPPETTSAPAPTAPPLDFGGARKIVLRRERKGRGGKTATVIEGLALPPSGLERIAREVKRAFGCGASTEGSTIVVQGDLAARIAPWLTARGAARVVVGT